MTTSTTPPAIALVAHRQNAELLLHPLRQRVLEEAARPSSAAEIARRLDMPAQKVNYHVRTLADAGFLVPAGRRTRGNLVERRYRASARAYVLAPAVLGPVSPEGISVPDAQSAGRLLQLIAGVQAGLGGALERGRADGVPVPTLSMEARVRFRSPGQRARFARALQEAVADVIGRFADPDVADDPAASRGDPYHFVVGCYPLADEHPETPGNPRARAGDPEPEDAPDSPGELP